MKQPPFEKALMTNLGPTRFSGSGFLGEDIRSLEEIVAEDLAFLRQAGIPKEGLLAALEAVYDKAKDAFGATVEIRSGVTALFHDAMGRVPSPFPGEGVFEKGEAVVTEHRSGKRLIITRLGLHLIERHDFFQGKGSRYRIEPRDALAVLGMA